MMDIILTQLLTVNQQYWDATTLMDYVLHAKHHLPIKEKLQLALQMDAKNTFSAVANNANKDID